MKFIAMADIHAKEFLPHSKADDSRTQYELKPAIRKALGYARTHNIAMLIVAGDFFDNVSLNPTEMEFFNWFCKQAKRCSVTVYCVSGNHEIDEKGNSAIKVLGKNKSCFITPKGKSSLLWAEDGETVIHLVDYCHTLEDFGNCINALQEKVNSLRRIKGKQILVAHQPIEGGLMRKKGKGTKSLGGIPMSWFKKGGILRFYDYQIFGDFHHGQNIVGGKGIYTGSVLQVDFRDEDNDNCFHVFDTNKDKMLIKSINYDSPKFHTIQIKEGEKPDYSYITKRSYIRIMLIGSKKWVKGFNVEVLKSYLVDEYSPTRIMVSEPVVLDKYKEVKKGTVRKTMTDEEIVSEVVKKANNDEIPDKLLYETGIKYLRLARKKAS